LYQEEQSKENKSVTS